MDAAPDVVARITQLSQGLPGYVHLLGEWSTRSAIARRSQNITPQDLVKAVSQALEKTDESTRQDYYKTIQSTKPDNRYREVLLACALAKKNELGRFSASDVCEPYSRIRNRQMNVVDFDRHLNAFCGLGRGPALIKAGKQKGFMYRFANPLLEPLVIMIGLNHAPSN